MSHPFRIGSRPVGPGNPSYIIAELSANHNHELSRAYDLVCAASEAGADAIKLQTYTADTLTLDCDNEHFKIKGTIWDGRTLYDLYKEAYTPWEWHAPIKEAAEKLGLDFFSTPFDNTAVDFLEELKVQVYKIASFENGDQPLLRRVAATGKPVIMSTGLATREELQESVQTLRENGCSQLALLKCTSAYPSDPAEMNLNTIPHLRDEFGVVAGLSDHSLSDGIPAAATALGASIIEKHLTLSRQDGGPDGAFSLEPDEFRRMVDAVRVVETALGKASYEPGAGESGNRTFRRSLFVIQDIAQGEPFTAQNVRSIRPAHGLHTRYLPDVLASRAAQNIPRGTPLTWDFLNQS